MEIVTTPPISQQLSSLNTSFGPYYCASKAAFYVVYLPVRSRKGHRAGGCRSGRTAPAETPSRGRTRSPPSCPRAAAKRGEKRPAGGDAHGTKRPKDACVVCACFGCFLATPGAMNFVHCSIFPKTAAVAQRPHETRGTMPRGSRHVRIAHSSRKRVVV